MRNMFNVVVSNHTKRISKVKSFVINPYHKMLEYGYPGYMTYDDYQSKYNSLKRLLFISGLNYTQRSLHFVSSISIVMQNTRDFKKVLEILCIIDEDDYKNCTFEYNRERIKKLFNE